MDPEEEFQELDLEGVAEDYPVDQPQQAGASQSTTPAQNTNSFDDATPASVNLQPNTAEANTQPDVVGGGVDKRVTSGDKQGLSPDAQPLPGDKQLFNPQGTNVNNPKMGGASGAAKNASKVEGGGLKGPAKPGTTTKPGKGAVVGAAANKIGDALGDNIAGKGVKLVGKAVDFAKTVALLIETFPVWGTALLVIIVAFLVGLIIAMFFMGRRLDHPSPGQLEGVTSADNRAGVYFTPDIAVPFMKVASGKEIHFETVAGTQGDEGHPGIKLPCGNFSACFTDDATESIPSAPQIKGYTAEELKYFINTRIPYIYGYKFSYYDSEKIENRTGYEGAPRPNWSSDLKDYYGKIVWVANPKTKKAVATVMVDNGPHPWTGVCKGRTISVKGGIYRLDPSLISLTSESDLHGLTSESCKEQQAAWDAREIVTNGAQYKDRKKFDDTRNLDPAPPANYTGFTIGTSENVQKVIGPRGDVVIYGWATDQTVRPGTVRDLSAAELKSSIRTKSGSGNGKTIVLDPGHGKGPTEGKYIVKNPNPLEAKIALAIGKIVQTNLEQAGYTVKMTRTDENSPIGPPPTTRFTRHCLTEKNYGKDGTCKPETAITDADARAYITSKANADLFVSLHADNAGAGKSEWLSIYNQETFIDKDDTGNTYTRGTEVIQKGRKLADALGKSYSATGFFKTGRTCQDAECAGVGTIGVLYLDNAPPAALLELGNLDDSRDLATLNDPAKRIILAKAISDGIINYLSK